MEKTADLCDRLGEQARVAEPGLRSFGGVQAFQGPVATVRVHEDNVLVCQALEEPGRGRVLVVDGGGSLRCALLGDRLARLALANGWAGVVVHGCVRDVTELARLPLGILALAAHPRKSGKAGTGERDVELRFASLTFRPGDWLVADEDGLLLTSRQQAGEQA